MSFEYRMQWECPTCDFRASLETNRPEVSRDFVAAMEQAHEKHHILTGAAPCGKSWLGESGMAP